MAALSDGNRIVVKIGSALLVDRATGQLRSGWLQSLAQDVAWLKGQGKDVVLVSSGSIALGRGVLGLPATTLALEQSQAAAAVGQIRLARAYEEALEPYGITAAQVLVTLEDSADRRRYLNSRATMEQLLSMGAVPIVNEHDMAFIRPTPTTTPAPSAMMSSVPSPQKSKRRRATRAPAFPKAV
mgnify:CR=1 FL=1